MQTRISVPWSRIGYRIRTTPLQAPPGTQEMRIPGMTAGFMGMAKTGGKIKILLGIDHVTSDLDFQYVTGAASIAAPHTIKEG